MNIIEAVKLGMKGKRISNKNWSYGKDVPHDEFIDPLYFNVNRDKLVFTINDILDENWVIIEEIQ